MWALVMRANTDDAKRVQRWVTHEVLPTLRKTGAYSTKGAKPIDPARAEDARRRTVQAAFALIKSTGDKDAIKVAALQGWEALMGPLKTTQAKPETPVPAIDGAVDLGWQSADFVGKAAGLNSSLVGKIASCIGIRDVRFEDMGIVRLSRQTLSEYQKDVPLWQCRGAALSLLLDACRAYAAEEFKGLTELAESQRFNAFRVLSS